MRKTFSHPRYWVNVVSYQHVKNGVKSGITQSCHGKSAPLKRMHHGDWVVHYSPKDRFQGKDPCQNLRQLIKYLKKLITIARSIFLHEKAL